jgi:hypothetical protein
MAPLRTRLVAGWRARHLHHHSSGRLGHRVGLGCLRARSRTAVPDRLAGCVRRASLVARRPVDRLLRQRVPGDSLYPGLLPLARPGHWRHGAQRQQDAGPRLPGLPAARHQQATPLVADSSTVSIHVREAGSITTTRISSPTGRCVECWRRATLRADRWMGETDHRRPPARGGRGDRVRGGLYAFASDGTACRQLTDLNAPGAGVLHGPRAQRVSHASPEGWRVPTWLWLPSSYRGRRTPASRALLRGPHSSVALGFNERCTSLRRGFAVVAVDFRGSAASAPLSRTVSSATGGRAGWPTA